MGGELNQWYYVVPDGLLEVAANGRQAIDMRLWKFETQMLPPWAAFLSMEQRTWNHRTGWTFEVYGVLRSSCANSRWTAKPSCPLMTVVEVHATVIPIEKTHYE
jgi:hypothetical protein